MSGPALLLAAVVSAGFSADAVQQGPSGATGASTQTPAGNQSSETKPPTSPDPKTVTPDPKTAPGARPPASPPAEPAGQGAPVVILGPMDTTARVSVRVPADAGSTDVKDDDLKAGLLTSTASPDLRIVPPIDVADGAKAADPVALMISELKAFGDLTVPLLYKGRQFDTLRFQKPGLIVRQPAGGVAAQQKSDHLLLVLENPSQYQYDVVRARVRFQGIDECLMTSDQPGGSLPSEPTWSDWVAGWWNWATALFRRTPDPQRCVSAQAWSAFAVRPSSQITLTIPLYDAWFKDLVSGLTRNASRQGVLTLRYYKERGSADSDFVEQTIPLDVRFDARATRLFLSIVWVFFLLLVGALFFLVLRVSIPNFRRKKTIKDRLNEARAAAARISDQVNSQLRVLVRVERLALDQQRREGWVLLPGFDELAARVEAGLATLNRKIGFVERLDAASGRRENLASGLVAPTRLEIIDRSLVRACETLKSDQLGDADWLSVQQQLEAADKALNEPSPAEKQAFEALLSQRWQLVRKHFEPAQGTRALTVPTELDFFKTCFPAEGLLPEAADTDGTKWVASVGVVRADLQLTALELLRELHFLSAALRNTKWDGAKEQLCEWLGTPAVANLEPARRVLQQIADGITPQELVDALNRKEAYIDMDPQSVSANQTVRLTVRFYDAKLNDATARGSIRCEWRFKEPTIDPARAASAGMLSRAWKRLRKLVKREGEEVKPAPAAPAGAQPAPVFAAHEHIEMGWRVHRYFQPDVAEQTIEVGFFYEGKPIAADPSLAQHYRLVAKPQERTHNKKDKNEKWLRFGFQTLQMIAVLLVPLITLAMSTAGEPASGRWWDLVGLGFGSEAIRGILTGEQAPPAK